MFTCIIDCFVTNEIKFKIKIEKKIMINVIKGSARHKFYSCSPNDHPFLICRENMVNNSKTSRKYCYNYVAVCIEKFNV